ncbi:hypothetical protein GCM10023185_20180 [Hymenobacter saemangeumensis]|uniref:UspA domain-containing protein n=1 Tax=Hymenobacter saemangeumensis TaxID=1084522 RepID=A0ABP8IDV0_9BACT
MPASLLILTDFFQASHCALNYATNLAAPLDARLVLLHVRRDSILDPELFTGTLSNLSQEAIATALRSVSGKLPVPVVAEVGHGRVAYAVADAVSRHRPALVVLGRPDYSATPDELVQTTALDILRTAPHPMLVVPHTMSSATRPRRILLAADGEAFSLGEHSGAVRHLLADLGAELTVLHVSPVPADDSTEQRALDSVLSTGLTVDLQRVHTRLVTHDSPAEAILDSVASGKFDMVALIARPRSFWSELFHRSVTAEVLLRSAVPVLVLPAQ